MQSRKETKTDKKFHDYSIWLITLISGMKVTVMYSLTPFAYSDFSSYSILTTITIVSSAMTSAVYIPMAKMIDVWGRAEGLLLMLSFCIIGLITLAASNGVASYCAGQVSIFSPKAS